jgi:hypothetical protein
VNRSPPRRMWQVPAALMFWYQSGWRPKSKPMITVFPARNARTGRYTWAGAEDEAPTYVSYRLEPHAGGTRFTYEHTGFTGAGGFFMARPLRRVRTKMLTVGLPAVLDDMN